MIWDKPRSNLCTLSVLFTVALNGVNFRYAALQGQPEKGPALKGPKAWNSFGKAALIF